MSTLYITATPIGNLNDISLRALEILKSVDLIAAEDTRHSQKLLQHYHISTSLIAYHDHNERENLTHLIRLLKTGSSIALITDAGTPAISDPGYHLVKAAFSENIKVVPIPGACAAICALSASGLPTDHFVFEGFLPAAPTTRKNRLSQLIRETRTLIFYEAPHRLSASLRDMATILGKNREATLARELTKTFETLYKSTLEGLCECVEQDAHQSKGEIVIVVSGASAEVLASQQLPQAKKILKTLLLYLPLKKAVSITTELFPLPKNLLYDTALALQKEKS